MGEVFYDYVVAHVGGLREVVRDINECQDKIVAVTQNGNVYTIFYERRGNEKREADGNGI